MPQPLIWRIRFILDMSRHTVPPVPVIFLVVSQDNKTVLMTYMSLKTCTSGERNYWYLVDGCELDKTDHIVC